MNVPINTSGYSISATANDVALDRLEKLIQTQRPASTPWEPVTDYSEGARKQAEGPHAQLILDVFKPQYAADMGCGFNYLATWVNTLAGHTVMVGVDRSNTNADFLDDITRADWGLKPRPDLIVCREVLEHLTIRQIVQAVRNMCAMTTRYVYVTTRFAHAPDHLLAVDTSDNLDPTHISMLNQDFLRVLFVLEGFRRRADLEERLDWQRKGRVLVYERP